TFVRPDAAALEPRGAVDESDHVGPEAHAGALRAREQHRASQVEDRATAIRAEGDGPAAAGGVPRASEFQPLTGCSLRFRRLRRWPAGRRCKGQGEQCVTPRHAAGKPSIVPPCPCVQAHGSLTWLMAPPATAMELGSPLPRCGAASLTS